MFINDQGETLRDDQAADSLNSFFASIFSHKIFPLPPYCPPYHEALMPPIIFTPEGILKTISDLSSNSAPGNDGISAKFLKLIDHSASNILSILFQQSLNSGEVPYDWRFSQVRPIFKSGTKSNPSNYRPISLTSVPCKLMEHVLYTHIISYLDHCDFFSPTSMVLEKIIHVSANYLNLPRIFTLIIIPQQKPTLFSLIFRKLSIPYRTNDYYLNFLSSTSILQSSVG